MFNPKILAIVLAGGEGKRLYPLTRDRTKPAVPFGSRYRVIDFVLSNLMNSRINSIYLLVQYKSQSLIEHIRRSWVLSPLFPEQFITVVPPQMREGPKWFQGTSDAVFQNLHLIRQFQPDLVAIFGADHIYRMDIRQMVRFHMDCAADVTVAALPVAIEDARGFGVIESDKDKRIRQFHEKSPTPPTMASDPTRCYASMGNYLFSTEVLLAELDESNRRGEKDFGQHLLPRLCNSHRLYAYDFSSNQIPGVRDYEEHNYWRDIGTIDAYYHAQQDLLGLEPHFNLFNPYWRIGSGEYLGPSAKIQHAEICNTVIGNGSFIKGAQISNSIIGCEVLIEEGAEIEDSILLDYTIIRHGARLRRTIVDSRNVIDVDHHVGYHLPGDASSHFVTESGIIVVSGKAIDTRAGHYP